MGQKAESVNAHETDADCAPYLPPDDGTEVLECPVCRVWHGDPCPVCGGRGYHNEGCAEIEPPIPAGFHASADGSTRCDRCALHPDTCTCRPEHPIWQVLAGDRP